MGGGGEMPSRRGWEVLYTEVKFNGKTIELNVSLNG